MPFLVLSHVGLLWSDSILGWAARFLFAACGFDSNFCPVRSSGFIVSYSRLGIHAWESWSGCTRAARRLTSKTFPSNSGGFGECYVVRRGSQICVARDEHRLLLRWRVDYSLYRDYLASHRFEVFSTELQSEPFYGHPVSQFWPNKNFVRLALFWLRFSHDWHSS